MVKDFVDYINLDGGNGISDYLARFMFNSQAEIEKAARLIIKSLATDPIFVREGKATRNADEQMVAIYTRAARIYKDEGKWTNQPRVLAGELWHGKMSRAVLDARVRAMFSVEADGKAFAYATKRIKEIYGLTDLDIEKIHYFVEQVKDGSAFPPSLRRMLYIWGDIKKSGKSTIGGMLTALLNGDDEVDESGVKNISKYKSSLSVEMQIESFSVPAISRCNCVLMDECFYADMGKTYNKFKDCLTSTNGRARLPYGQEFEWRGFPNYIATSNDELAKFIKDESDRRYLSIHLTQRPKEMPFAEVGDLWKMFVLNSQRSKSWAEWTNELFEAAEEKGEKSEYIGGYYILLTRTEVLTKLQQMPIVKDKWSADNKFTLNDWIKLLSDYVPTMDLVKQKNEIRTAAKKFLPCYSTQQYWLRNDVRARAIEIMENKVTNETKPEAEEDKLPF